jgi:hypothetical protein
MASNLYRRSPIHECLYRADGSLQALFRLFPAARDARVAGEAESNHGNLGVYRLRPEQNGFGILNAFGASKRIGETMFDTH